MTFTIIIGSSVNTHLEIFTQGAEYAHHTMKLHTSDSEEIDPEELNPVNFQTGIRICIDIHGVGHLACLLINYHHIYPGLVHGIIYVLNDDLTISCPGGLGKAFAFYLDMTIF